MTYKVHVYSGNDFEEHTLTSEAKAIALAKQKKAAGWQTVVVLADSYIYWR